jgi:hypothetical protein
MHRQNNWSSTIPETTMNTCPSRVFPCSPLLLPNCCCLLLRQLSINNAMPRFRLSVALGRWDWRVSSWPSIITWMQARLYCMCLNQPGVSWSCAFFETLDLLTFVWRVGNHHGIFNDCGFEVRTYRYYNYSTLGLDYQGFTEDLEVACLTRQLYF